MSSSNSNNGNNSSSYSDRLERKRAEGKLVERFRNIFSDSVDEFRRQEGETFELQPAERSILLSMNNVGLWQGAVAGVVTLITLRTVRWRVIRKLEQRVAQPPPPPPPGGGAPHVTNSPFTTPPPPSQLSPARRSPLLNVLGWSLDLAASFFTAVGVTTVCTDVSRIQNAFAGLPLVPGRSPICDAVCPKLLAELQTLSRQDAETRDILEHPQTSFLQAVTKFGANCQRRRDYEAHLRREQGLSAEDPVSIPEPGVPVTDDEEWSTSSSEAYESQGSHESDFYDPSQDEFGNEQDSSQWADSFVTDQEEDESDRSRRA